MGQQTNDNFILTTAKAVDDKYGKTIGGRSVPYASTTEANSLISIGYRYRGLTVYIDDGTGMKEYWYRDDVTDQSLILKSLPAALSQALQTIGVGDMGGIPSGTIFAANTTLEAIIRQLLIKEIPPTYNNPTLVLTSDTSGIYEMGFAVSPNLTATFTQNDAGSLINIKFNSNGTQITNITTAPFVYNDPSYALNAVVQYQSNAFFGTGPIKNTNIGNPYTTGRITASNILSNIVTLTPVYPYFFGTSDSPSNVGAGIYSGSVDTASTKVIASVPNTISISNFGSSDSYIWFAVPQGTKDFTTWFVSSINNGAIGGGSNLFATKTVISVTSTLGWTKNYDVYISNYVTTVSGTMQLN